MQSSFAASWFAGSSEPHELKPLAPQAGVAQGVAVAAVHHRWDAVNGEMSKCVYGAILCGDAGAAFVMGSCEVCKKGEACLGTTGTEAHPSCACHGALLWVIALSWHCQVGRYNQQNYEGWPLMNCRTVRDQAHVVRQVSQPANGRTRVRSTTSLTLRGRLWLIPS